LLQACAVELSRISGVTVEPRHLIEATLPAHLRMRIAVLDDKGNEIAQGRSLEELQQRLGQAAQRKFMDEQGAGFNRNGLTGWQVGSLPQRIVTAGGQPAYPALVDQASCAGLRLFDTAEEAATAHTDGVLRLCALTLADRISWLRKHHGLSRMSLLAWSPMGPAAALIDDLVASSLQHACGDCAAIRDEQAFAGLQGRLRSVLGVECQAQADVLNLVLPLHSRISADLNSQPGGAYAAAREDIRGQLEDLVYAGFLQQLEAGRLQQYPRYFAAIEERLRALQENPQRDGERMRRVQPWWDLYLQSLHGDGGYDRALDAYRWLVEEYRVSLFAQRLGTAVKVSDNRLAAAWQNVLA
jgi:ATP-dependent helicase HrpA